MIDKKRLSLLGLAVSAVLAGCGGGGGGGAEAPAPAQPTAAVMTQLTSAGSTRVDGVTLDRSTTSIPGTDANGDGVRDDVEAWIGAQSVGAEQRASLRQLAAAYQTTLVLNLTDDAAVRAARLAASNAVECVMQQAASIEAGYKAVADVRRVTVNTNLRATAYLAYAEKVNDTVSRSPDGNGCQ